MIRTSALSAIIGLLVGITPALAQTLPPSTPITTAPVAPQGVDASGGQLSITPEYLMWWLRGERLPPLVTTSPSGTPMIGAGVLGFPGTQTVFGDKSINGDSRSGGRLTADYWLDPNQTWGIEARFFMLEALNQNIFAPSAGDLILARPFINTATGQADAQLVAFPGLLQGSVAASARSSNLLGAEALLRGNLLALKGCYGGFRLDALAGYRFLYFDEGLSLQENLGVISNTSPVPAGTAFVVSDKFGTHNVFHGGELVLAAGLRSGAWSLDFLGKLAAGVTCETVNITGSTAITLPGGPTTVLPGGLLALNSNIGRHTENAFSLVPELNVNLGYWVTDNVRLTAGYSLLFWTNIVRPGDQIDLSVNPNLLPPVLPGGAPHPAFFADRTPLWAQGVSVGFEIRY